MGFWLYCTAMCLLIPGIMLYFGWRFLNKPPKNINSMYGYRTQPLYEKPADLGLCPSSLR